MPRNSKTKTDIEVFTDVLVDTCFEPDCGASVLVDKSDKEQGRKARCIACLIRSKVRKGELK